MKKGVKSDEGWSNNLNRATVLECKTRHV